MSINQVGYKLINSKDKSVVDQWGGIWGQCPGVPNPIILPNGHHIHAPELNTDYSGYKLIIWEMEPPVVKELTLEEKLASVGLTLQDIKDALK